MSEASAPTSKAPAGKPPNIKLVTFEFDPFPGGVATYAAEMARAIARAGASVQVIAPEYDGLPTPAWPFPVTRPLAHWRLDRAAISDIAAFLASGPPADAVLATDVRAAAAALDATQGRAPVVTMFHGSEILRAANNDAARQACRRVAAHSAAVANSRFTADLVSSVIGQACAHAPLGVSGEWFDPAPAAFEAPALGALPAGQPVICLVGRLEPRKGQLTAVRVAQALAKQIGPTFTLVLAGFPSDPDYAQEVNDAAGDTPPLVCNAGVLSRADLRLLYARSRCLLLPAQAWPQSVEGFGLVALEAAAQACPSLVTQVGGLPEAVSDDVTGFVVAEHDTNAMTARLAQLIRDDATHARLSTAALDRAKASTWDETLRATPILGELLHSPA